MELRSSKSKQTQSEAGNVVKAPNLVQTKKRKTQDGNDYTESSKPLKQVRGLLKNMVEMPMDVLFEVFGLLEPLDLLHISRTTKALRAMLMSRSSISVWKSARSKVVGLPDCPNDLNEPQYAALIFVTRCTFCQKNIPDIHISWYARVRCCTKCAHLNFVPVSQRPSSDRGCPALLADWVPFVMVTRKLRWTTSETLYVSESTENQWRDEYWTFKNLKSRHEWLLRTIEARYQIHRHARACAFWHDAWSNNTDVDKLRQVLERNAQITTYIKRIKRIEGICLEEELYKVPPTEPDPLDKIEIQPLWNPLGPSVQNSTFYTTLLRNLLSTKLSESKRRRENLANRDFLISLKPFLSEIYNNGIKTLAINFPSPTLAQVYHIAEIHDLIDYSMTAADALRVPFCEVVTLWKKHVSDRLIDIIQKNTRGLQYEFNPATVLDLATTFFRCESCYDDNPSPSMRRDEVMTHLCTEIDESQRVFLQVLGPEGWCNGYWGTLFDQEDLKMMQKVVEMCGLDPKVTTACQMDELDPIFECRGCSSFEEGRLMMSWTAVLSHQQLSHRASPQIHTLRILEEPDATKVRERIKEEQMRQDYRRWYQVVCPHCRSVLINLKLYQQHLKEEHKISKMKYKELIFSYRQSRIPPEYRLFPPLDEESD